MEPQIDVHGFINENGLDERAANALLTCSPQIQSMVIAQGNLTDSRNPSSALLGRLRNAQSGKGGGMMFSAGPPVENISEAVEAFIVSNGVDDQAASQMRASTPEIQSAVLARGDITGAKNPSSALACRIRDANVGFAAQNAANFANVGGSEEVAAFSQEQISAFIAENALDEKAANALLTCKPHVQNAVIARGSLADAKNPSSALLGRLRDAQSGKGKGFGKMQAQAGFGMMQTPQSSGGVAFGIGGIRSNPAQVEKFLSLNNVDERAASALRGLAPEIQAIVLARGTVSETQNASSTLMGRIRDAQAQAQTSPGQTQQVMGNMAMPMCNPGSQQFNPGMNGGCSGFVSRQELDQFILNCGVDERAASALRESDPAVQMAVLSRGLLNDSRNPSSALMGRLRDACKSVAMGGGGGRFGNGCGQGGGNGFAQGGMGCGAQGGNGCGQGGGCCGNGGCGLNGCGQDGGCCGNGGCGWNGCGQGGGCCGNGSSSGMPFANEVERFLAVHNLDEKACNALREADTAVQSAVIARGTLTGFNPSAALVVRIRDAKAGGESSGLNRSSPYGW